MSEKKTSGCPVNHGGDCALPADHPPIPTDSNGAAAAGGAAGGAGKPAECPVKHDGQPKRKVYNVYAQLIDPTNQMPKNPNQEPAEGQRMPLSTGRVQSNIPKGGTDADTWLYPSPQMFFNALRRKGKDDGFREENADIVVAIHNNMNERTWGQVLMWEKLYCE